MDTNKTSNKKPILIIIILIVGLIIFFISSKVSKDPVIIAAEKYFDRTREDIKNYKDIKFKLIDKQEKTAKVRVEFATSRICAIPQKIKPDNFKDYYTPLSKGYIELSEKDVNDLTAMGLVKSGLNSQGYLSAGASNESDWKKCYEVVNLKKYGDSWEFSGDKDEGTPLGAGLYYFFFPPGEQKKL